MWTDLKRHTTLKRLPRFGVSDSPVPGAFIPEGGLSMPVPTRSLSLKVSGPCPWAKSWCRC